MFTKILICFLVFKVVTSQINGEFWWLNDKLAKLKNVEPPRPKFDEVGELDTDESAKVVFRDSLYNAEEENKYFDITTIRTEVSEAMVYFRDDNKRINPVNVSEKLDINAAENNDINYVNKRKIKNYNEDILNFIFPSDNEILKNVTVSNRTSTILTSENYTETNVNKNETFNDKMLFNTIKEVSLIENICTYMKKSECYRCNGLPYAPENSLKSKRHSRNLEEICCILPLTKHKSSKISFPDSSTYNDNRLKRSTNETDKISPALKQRNVLLQRKYGSQMWNKQTISTTQKPLQKIVTSGDDYNDPYLNIKNSNLRPPDKQQDYQTGSSQQEYYNDYVEDYYAPELPKPGLVGLFSDHKPSHWTFVSADKWIPYDNVESGEKIASIGYPTIDPRGGSLTTASNFKRRLLKQNINSKIKHNAEKSQVSYRSNPDFQVLQGFKLLNLMTRNKHRPIRISSETSTTQSFAENSEEDPNFEPNIDNDYDDYIDNMQLAYRECGRTREKNVENYNCDSALGDVARGSHPWLLLVVLTKRQQSILCYATLIHPRVAVTAADCTYGISPGEISIIAGVWDLKEDNRAQLQHRLASVHIHQQYLPGKLAYNIALLYWKRPLRLDSGVLPACVTDANVKDTCMFVGWGGYDQAISQRPRWQRASILSPRSCVERISIDHGYDLPIDAFCASVKFKTTVTGLGGPLMCTAGDVFSVAGVAVWRDDVVVLMQVREWVTKALSYFEN